MGSCAQSLWWWNPFVTLIARLKGILAWKSRHKTLTNVYLMSWTSKRGWKYISKNKMQTLFSCQGFEVGRRRRSRITWRFDMKIRWKEQNFLFLWCICSVFIVFKCLSICWQEDFVSVYLQFLYTLFNCGDKPQNDEGISF